MLIKPVPTRTVLQVNERLKTLGPGRGRGRGPGYAGPASFRGGPLPGRGMPGRGAYPGQDHYGPAPGNLSGLPHVGQTDRSYRTDRYPARPPADARPSVMDRLGPSFPRDNRRQTRELDSAPNESIPVVEVRHCHLLLLLLRSSWTLARVLTQSILCSLQVPASACRQLWLLMGRQSNYRRYS